MQQVMKLVLEPTPFNLKGYTVAYVPLDCIRLHLFIVEF